MYRPILCLRRSTSTVISAHYSSSSPIKSIKEIPGPFKLPFIGNLYLYKLGIYKVNQYHKVLQHLHQKYGAIVQQKLGSETLIHVFDPADIRTVYKAEGRMPYVVPLQETVQVYRERRGLSLGLGNLNGDEWYRLRSAAQQAMLRPSAVSQFLPLVDRAAQEFINRISQMVSTGGEIPKLRDLIGKWSLESAGAVCFERTLGCLRGGGAEERAQSMVDANKVIFHLSGQLKFSLPIYKYIITTPKWKKLVAAEDFFYGAASEFVNEAINELKKLQTDGTQSAEGKFSFLAHLLSRKELQRSDVDIITLSLFGDGLSTTTPFLLCCLRCLADSPEAQERLRGEVKTAVLENGSLNADKLANLPYLRAVIKEAFRIYPNGTEISRIVQQDLVLSGYLIPSGTHVNLNPSVNFLSEKYFSQASQFLPERWLRTEAAHNIDPYLLTPFGHGTRTCAGRRFAEQDLHVLLTRLLQKFKLVSTANEPLKQVYETLLFPVEPLGIKFIPL